MVCIYIYMYIYIYPSYRVHLALEVSGPNGHLGVTVANIRSPLFVSSYMVRCYQRRSCVCHLPLGHHQDHGIGLCSTFGVIRCVSRVRAVCWLLTGVVGFGSREGVEMCVIILPCDKPILQAEKRPAAFQARDLRARVA